MYGFVFQSYTDIGQLGYGTDESVEKYPQTFILLDDLESFRMLCLQRNSQFQEFATQ